MNRAIQLLGGRNKKIYNFATPARRGKSDLSDIMLKFSSLKDKFIYESVLFMKHTVLQIDYITVNRLKRINSPCGLYSRLYEKEKLREILLALSRSIRARSKQMLLGATVFSVFDWDGHKVNAADLSKYSKEIDHCALLTQETLTCPSCGNRWRIDKEVDGVKYCRCEGSPKSVYGLHKEKGDWSPFLERKDIVVWRKDHPTQKGMYIYKMYGRFEDVTAEEFMKVQLDMSEFRLSWDTSTAQCYVLDQNAETKQEVYYWEVNWPRFFSNRDYCCVRQTLHDEESGTTVLISRSTDHPNCPIKRKCLRVEDYDSVLTVKPFSSPDKLGIEFSLTGFENPGVQLPESIITWVAIRGMPEFMLNLRKACIKLRSSEDTQKSCSASLQSQQTSKSNPSNVESGSDYVNRSSRIYA